jgi:hypothetical protein
LNSKELIDYEMIFGNNIMEGVRMSAYFMAQLCRPGLKKNVIASK